MRGLRVTAVNWHSRTAATNSRWPEVEKRFPRTPSGREPLLLPGTGVSRDFRAYVPSEGSLQAPDKLLSNRTSLRTRPV